MRVDLRGIHAVTVKGKTYRYAWRGGPRLTSLPGSHAFVEEFAAAQAARKTGDKTRISGLCARYRASDAYKGLAPKTKDDWARWLTKIQDHFGHLSIAAFDRPRIVPAIRAWRDKAKNTPRAADVGLEVLSRLLSFGKEEGLLTTNAATSVPRLPRNNRAHVIWTSEDLAEFAKHASPPLVHAANLAALTGLRQSDLLRLSWSHIGELAIEIPTGKSGMRKVTLIPLYAELKDYLAALPRKSTRVLVNTRGHPWGTGFKASWQTAMNKTKIGKHFHDLRGTAATKFYRADLSIREIAEVMTWSEGRVDLLINRYVKRDELLKDRIRRLDRTPGERKV